ncbi:hypothetical protein BP00DRAFT_425431 [Aspergillus indologenus CBS 114.80]|uniref:Uncharacterized protein n=1 Tax=Aspergillus indologenus CBS 114.80 TaxID=1450541 RepID=A0A2V5J9X7_9EURO|nr:hypothetical protein BP00DRAFT_425431 [Aspergillus indologenus CBS 114.80]
MTWNEDLEKILCCSSLRSTEGNATRPAAHAQTTYSIPDNGQSQTVIRLENFGLDKEVQSRHTERLRRRCSRNQ